MGACASSNPELVKTSIVPADPADPAPDPAVMEDAPAPAEEIPPTGAPSDKAAADDGDKAERARRREEAKRARDEQRALVKQQMQKDRQRFKEGLPTSPVANDAARQNQIANFDAGLKLEPKSPPPSESPKNSVVTKEGDIVSTDYE